MESKTKEQIAFVNGWNEAISLLGLLSMGSGFVTTAQIQGLRKDKPISTPNPEECDATEAK